MEMDMSELREWMQSSVSLHNYMNTPPKDG